MTQKSSFQFVLVSIAFVLVVAACGSPEAPAPTLDMNAAFTLVAGTIAAEYTQTALAIPPATNTPEPTATPLASPTSQALIITSPTPPVPTITPTYAGLASLYINPATANGCFNAGLVEDVTVPAGTKYKAGDTFKKTWRLINTGTCDWTADFKITYVGGNLFGSDTTKIRQRVAVGNTGDISLDMVAPASAGTVVSNWQMATDTGALFGPVLTISIELPSQSPSGNCYNSALVSDVTIPNGTEFEPGDDFTKTWQIENTGTCDWNENFRIKFVGGDLFGSDTTKTHRYTRSGETINISLNMTAPNGSGPVTSSWRMADDSGTAFGQIFTVQIVLK
jgi:hypothetical protein